MSHLRIHIELVRQQVRQAQANART